MRRFFAALMLLFLLIAPAAFAAAVSWEVQVSGTNVNLNGITTLSSSTAIAVGEDFTILKTINYGQTWTAKTTPNVDYDLKAVYFPSPLIGYAVGRNPSADSGFCYKTTDGGETWVVSSTGISVANSSGLYDVFFVNDLYGFACGHHLSVSGVVKTIDGGVSWTTVGGGPGSNNQYNSVFFNDVNNGCLVGAQGKIYTTANGGTIWTAPVGVVTDTLNDVYFIDANNGWIGGNAHDFGVAGVKGSILKTTNGGTSWSLINSNLSDHLSAIQFLSTSDGWVAGFGNNANIAKTTNGGSAWSYDKQVSSNTGVNDLDLFDSINGWAVGDSGLILHRPSMLTITTVSPPTANQGDTTNLTINGTNFLADIAASGITFSANGITVNSLTFVDETQLIANITIAGTATIGQRSITVTNSNGQATTATNAFSVNPAGVTPPTITSISPTQCAQATTIDLTITGSNFHPTPTPTVTFSGDGLMVNTVTCPSATTINANITTTATATASWRAVTVQNSDDSGITTKNDLFKVNNSPSIISVLPNSGNAGNSNLPIYITGDNFAAGATLSFSAASGASAATVDPAATSGITINTHEVVNANAIRANISLATASTGLYNLTLTNPDQGVATRVNCYTVDPATINPEIANQRGLFLPNPWNPNNGAVELQINVSKAATLTFIVTNIAGRKIASFTRTVEAGQNTIAIDRSMFPGHNLSNGIIIVVVISDNRVIAKAKLTVQYQ